MSPEAQKPSELNILTTAAIIGGIYLLSQFAFSRPVRRKIWERDGGKCVNCGSTEHLNCAHIDHSRENPRYNHESNGRLLCQPDHYLIDHVNREGRNGLPIHQNQYAKRTLWQKLTGQQKEKLPPPEPEEQTW